MQQEFDKPYNPAEHEDKTYKTWEESGFFNPDNYAKPNKSIGAPEKLVKNAKTFTIAIPPPNVTGSLHMGHALNATIQDILIRKRKMEGKKTLWVPGTDHAGIATQNVVEKELKKQGTSRHDLGREKFLENVWEWKEKYGNIILLQLKKIGASCDWTRTRFTMDPEYQKAVEAAFLHYYNKGWIYKGERVINWCVRCQTSLSDLELEYQEEKSKLWFIKYPIANSKDYIVVATTRPETMLGDTAVAVNPKDKRYKNFIGKKVMLPIQNREIQIISDRRIEMAFGTGAVKVTPAHDMLDEAISQDNALESIQVINEIGRMTKDAGVDFENLKVAEARKKVIEKLNQLGLIERTEDYMHNIAKCYRCGSTIEPLKSKQWFLKMSELAKLAEKAVKSKKIKFHPKRWDKVYLDWLKNIKDWTISRQIWWGHKIPLDGVDDVLDTWFSSALWPFVIFGWPEKTADFDMFYPTQVLSTARDIINLWVARMIFSGLELTKKEPFKDVIIHATILTKDGKRMSKSLGTGIDPIVLIDKYGADATRFGLIWQTMGAQELHWSEEHVVAGKKFCNKIWNAARFVSQQTAISSESTSADKKIIRELNKTKKEIDKLINKYQFGKALHIAYDFFWHEFCDIYIEKSKENLNVGVLNMVFKDSLKMLHPFMPFITEAIWDTINSK